MRFKSLLFLLCVLLCTHIVGYAQQATRIFGKITDTLGAPISNATIRIKGGQGTSTNLHGEYNLTAKGIGDTTIIVTGVGYNTAMQKVNLTGADVNLDFRLHTDAVGLNIVVVTATTSRRTQLQTPMSVTSFNSAQLSKARFNSQADILRGIPGITAEGGGGEVAANIFVRGLPSSGQYQFTPLQIDGMPVISTMGINSSAPDVYFRPDVGFSSLEFVRGGSATLYGIGSVAGIINYTSKTGTDIPSTIIETTTSTPGRAQLDFNTGGPLSSENKIYYDLSGFYRYDSGPIITGSPSNGYQLRGNIKKVMENGSLTLSGQYINDRVQFYLPYHLTSDRQKPVGWDGKIINTEQTNDIENLSARTPFGIYQTQAANLTYTNGGYFLADFKHYFSNDWKFDAKIRTAQYEHQFNFFTTDGTGRNPETQPNFLTSIGVTPTSYTYSYADDNSVVNPSAKVLVNSIIDRIRPMHESAAQLNISKVLQIGSLTNNLNLGTFLATTTAGDFDVQFNYLSEFKDQPKLLNLNYTNASGLHAYTKNGVSAISGYTNRKTTSNKLATTLSDEIVWGKLRFDAGLRFEGQYATVINERSARASNIDNINVVWGTGQYERFNLHASDYAVALAANYQVRSDFSIYANFSRGYFFPELRGYSIVYINGIAQYPNEVPEHIKQGEFGLKFGNATFTATLAGFAVDLKNRLSVSYQEVNGALVESVAKVSTYAYGMEATWDWAIIKYLHFGGSLTLQHAVYTAYDSAPTNVGKWLERQPRTLLTTSLSYNNGKFDISASNDYNSKRYGNANNAVELAPYSITRTDLGYSFKLDKNSRLRVGAGVFNLFNSNAVTQGNPFAGDAQANTGTYFVGRVILPRSYLAKVTLTF